MTSRFAAAALLLLAACGSSAGSAIPDVSSPTVTVPPVSAAPTPATPRVSRTPSPLPQTSPLSAPWVVGASPLPTTADGFGKVLPTPEALVNRRLQAVDVLPPPPDGQFHATAVPITPEIRTRMGDTYREGCPVPVADLRYVTLTFRGFDGVPHTGELVVAATAVEPTANAFRALFTLGFPIEQMRLPTSEDVNAAPTGDGNDTAAYVCRAARGQTRFSAHAYGLAVDVNPFQNPFVRGQLVLPELASAYTDRGVVRAGMFEPGSPEVRAFTDQGFTWGGTFSRPKDYQHMSLTGT